MSYGKILSEERKKNSLSVEEVAAELKINLRVLKSIEASNSKDLPSAPYTKGFLRSYCSFLKIDSKPVVDSYTESLGEKVSEDVKESVLKGEFDPSPFFLSDFLQRRLLPVFLLVAFLGLGVLVYRILPGVESSSDVTAATEEEREQRELVAEENLPDEILFDETAENSKISKEEVKKERAEKTKVSKVDESSKAKPEVKSLEPAKALVEPSNKLVVEPLAKTYLYIKTSTDEKFIRASLKPDKTRVFKFETATIKFVDAGAVNIFLNGKEIGAPGTFAERKTIEFPSMKGL